MLKRKSRPSAEVDSSSMADIAFLLLVFFLVTTKIDTDKGIAVMLPPYSEEPPPDTDINDRNAFIVIVNSLDQLLVENEQMKVEELRKATKDFIANPMKKENLSSSPLKATVSFRADRGTSYEMYLKVYNELKAAYNELRNEESLKRHNRAFDDLDPKKDPTDTMIINEIKKVYPLRISESEPVNYGG